MGCCCSTPVVEAQPHSHTENLRAHEVHKKVARGIEKATALITAADAALAVGEAVPLLGNVCSVARNVLEQARVLMDKVDDVAQASARVLSVLSLLESMESNAKRLGPGAQREKVEACMGKLHDLLSEMELFIEGFGEAGWLRRAFDLYKCGRKLSTVDEEMGKEMATLRSFYDVAIDAMVLDGHYRLEAAVAAVAARLEGLADEAALRTAAHDAGVAPREVDAEIVAFLREGFTRVEENFALVLQQQQQLQIQQQHNHAALLAALEGGVRHGACGDLRGGGGQAPPEEENRPYQPPPQYAFRSVLSHLRLHVRESHEALPKHEAFILHHSADSLGSNWIVHFLDADRPELVALQTARAAADGKRRFLHVRASWEKLAAKRETKCCVLCLKSHGGDLPAEDDVGSRWTVVRCSKDGAVALRSGRVGVGGESQFLHVRRRWASLTSDKERRWQVLQLHPGDPDTTEGSRWQALTRQGGVRVDRL
jgi:hypothetical protein